MTRVLTRSALQQLSGRLPPEGGQLPPKLRDVPMRDVAEVAWRALEVLAPLARMYCPILMGRMDHSLVVMNQPNPQGERQLTLEDLRQAYEVWKGLE